MNDSGEQPAIKSKYNPKFNGEQNNEGHTGM